MAGAATAFGCADDDSSTNPSAGNGGAQTAAGASGKGGSAGKGGGTAGSSGEAGAAAGEAGEGNASGTGGGGTGGNVGGSAGSIAGGGTSGGGTAGSIAGGGTAGGDVGGTAGSIAGGGTAGGDVGGTAGSIAGGGSGGSVGGNGGSGGSAVTTGSLSVTLSGVPAGKTASVMIAGPNNFTQIVSAATTLADIAAGTYSITAPSIRVAGTQVDSVYDATISGSATVTPNGTSTAAISYALRPGAGLWATNATTKNAFRFDAAAIAKTGANSDAATATLNLDLGGNGTIAIAFSSTGALWASSCKSSQFPQTLGKYDPAKLATSGTPVADVKITLPATDVTYDCPDALAFDDAGNLWVGFFRGHILKYNAADLTVTGTPAPAVVLSGSYFGGIVDLAFDSAGNLYVCPYNFGVPVISRLSPAQLTASDSAIVPAVRLTVGTTGAGLGGIALGSDGSLWVADYNHGGATSSILKLKASDLGTTGTPTPALAITGIAGPEQMAFDNAGNLWIASYDSSKVVALSAGDLATGGAKTPLTTLTAGGSLSTTFAVRFNPGAP
ncbi:MAG TPA: hypothetical protein VFK05_19060 [Polyangiaceae bacterium]|nr:hypothetical protein [Polyangiaceae bacterium]